MTKKSLTILLAIFAVVALAVPAQAVLVTRNASAVFYDDFKPGYAQRLSRVLR